MEDLQEWAADNLDWWPLTLQLYQTVGGFPLRQKIFHATLQQFHAIGNGSLYTTVLG
jgi:hypothetical protein